MASKLPFKIWMQKVNAIVARHGVSVEDLPDCPYADWYEDGMSPAAGAMHALRNAGAS